MESEGGPPVLTAAYEEGDNPPPLPPENPPPLPSPPPLPPSLSPPPSMQMSSPLSDWLDFDPGVGGFSAALDDEGAPPPSKKAKLDNESQGGNGTSVTPEPPNLLSDSDTLEEGEISDWDGPGWLNTNNLTTQNLTNVVQNSCPSLTAPAAVKEDVTDALAKTVDALLQNLDSQPSLEDGENPDTPENGENSGENMGSNSGEISVENSGENSVENSAENSAKNTVETAVENAVENSVENVAQNSEEKKTLGSENSDNDEESFLKQQFEIIDDLGGSEDEIDEYDSDELDEEEIDALLDEGLQVRKRPRPAKDGEPVVPVEREKVILKEISKDPFDILPEGWVMLTHDSGMPVYLHKESRVCTYSRPYFLGSGSARKHDIPLSAIPCLHYRRDLQKLEQKTQGEDDQQGKSQEGTDVTQVKQEVSASVDGAKPDTLTNGTTEASSSNEAAEAASKQTSSNEAPTNDKAPTNNKAPTNDEAPTSTEDATSLPVKVASVESYKKEKTLDAFEVRKYCENLFMFEHLTVKKYRTWKDRREHAKMMKSSRPILPSNTKLITCPAVINKFDESMPNRKKEFVLNPAGKTEICILHEYVQHSLRVQPKYIFKELENAQTPYSATVLINDVMYGTGFASSKKAAKNEAAKATLSIMIPQLSNQGTNGLTQDIHDLSFFDEVKIEDPRVHDLCNKAGQPSPFQILCECLRRNFGMGDTNCKMEMKTLKHQKSEFVMQVGKHTATVLCKNKREGKQLAAQAILQLLHPHIQSWGSLLRLYGTDWKAIKEKEEEVSVIALHAKAKLHQPNLAILRKLRDEMKKLQMRQSAMKSNVKGKLELTDIPANNSLPGVDL